MSKQVPSINTEYENHGFKYNPDANYRRHSEILASCYDILWDRIEYGPNILTSVTIFNPLESKIVDLTSDLSQFPTKIGPQAFEEIGKDPRNFKIIDFDAEIIGPNELWDLQPSDKEFGFIVARNYSKANPQTFRVLHLLLRNEILDAPGFYVIAFWDIPTATRDFDIQAAISTERMWYMPDDYVIPGCDPGIGLNK